MVSWLTTAYILAKELLARGVAQRYCRMETYPPAYLMIRLDRVGGGGVSRHNSKVATTQFTLSFFDASLSISLVLALYFA